MTRIAILVAASLVCLAGRAPGMQGPAEWDPDRVVATRDGLANLRSRLVLAAQSPAYSSRLRAVATSEIAAIDRRLAVGDFQPGDRIALQVAGEKELTDTFTVGGNRDLLLPLAGDVSLNGVLRSDVGPFFQHYLSTYLRSPIVRAQPLIPLSVIGSVGLPGFYTVPAGIPLTQLLQVAHGPTPDANLSGITIEREGRVIWEGAALGKAITDGRTLEDLGVRAGDRVVVPTGTKDLFKVVETISYALGIPIAAYTLVRLFSGK
ncbi:MAG TPA: polysaccharide biosynthesis/export family protein [Gemmatimonadales bacterium]|nr:polysaccharide biosynthesis/export family protein [Gemmatimonadales bacterium]